MKRINKKMVIRENGSLRVATIFTKPSRTQQHHAEACDVNNIVAKYKKTGEFVHRARSAGVYADISQISDYQSAVIKIQDAQSAFSLLPASARLKFNNDPGNLIAFMQDPNNYDEGVELGIFEKRPKAEAIKHDEPNDVKKAKAKKDESQTPKENPN